MPLIDVCRVMRGLMRQAVSAHLLKSDSFAVSSASSNSPCQLSRGPVNRYTTSCVKPPAKQICGKSQVRRRAG